jgi:pyridinium-3,5-biscarboxylic acid mononucleotide synthase
MDEATLRQLLDEVRSGAVSADEAVARLRRLPFADLGWARVDHHRALRQGFAETVYGPGKTPEQCARLVVELLDQGEAPVILSRADNDQVMAAHAAAPGGERSGPADTEANAGLATVVWRPAARRPETVLIVTGGTADLPVAEECRAVLAAFGLVAPILADCGVAGVHRLLAHAERIDAADAVAVVAGMEGAVASVVAGLTGAPVVAVPTSFGYGSSLEGVTALLAMLASCAAGLTVVGIDNGFGAAHAIVRLLGPRDPAGETGANRDHLGARA